MVDFYVVLHLFIAVDHYDATVFALEMLLFIFFQLLLLLVVLTQKSFNSRGFITSVFFQFRGRRIELVFCEFGIPARIQVIFGERRFLFLIRHPVRKRLLVL